MPPVDDIWRMGGIIIFFHFLFARTANEPGRFQGNNSSFVDSANFLAHFRGDATQPAFVFAKIGGHSALLRIEI